MAEEETPQDTGARLTDDPAIGDGNGREAPDPDDGTSHPEDRAAEDAEHTDVEVEREQDAPAVAELDPETKARRDAALRQVRKFGDPVLRAKALDVDRFDDELEAEVTRMG